MSSVQLFATSRNDGRTDSEVIIDLVKSAHPGTVFTFDEIGKALSEGTGKAFDRQAVQAVASRSVLRLAKETQRALHNIRGVGYRVAAASDHCRLANHRKKRSDRQLTKGLAVLQHVRWEEMDQNQRNAHQAQLMILQSVVTNQRSLDRRMSRIEEAIKKGLERPVLK